MVQLLLLCSVAQSADLVVVSPHSNPYEYHFGDTQRGQSISWGFGPDDEKVSMSVEIMDVTGTVTSYRVCVRKIRRWLWWPTIASVKGELVVGDDVELGGDELAGYEVQLTLRDAPELEGSEPYSVRIR
jgi:hypothetical protein